MCLPILLLVAAAATSSTGESYLIIDAVVSSSRQNQPTWIALNEVDTGDSHHVPANQGIVLLPEGRYAIKHIDFDQDPNSARGTVYTNHLGGLEFEVASGSITYVGRIEIAIDIRFIDGSFRRVPLISLIRSPALAQRACTTNIDAIKRLPVRALDASGRLASAHFGCAT